MALFGSKNKSTDDASAAPSAPAAPKPARKGLGLGRKKGGDTAVPVTPAPVAPATTGGFEDFSDFSDAVSAPPASLAPDAAAAGGTGAPRGKAVKNGVIVGLNIGNDAIKAVEVRAKGGQLAVTALGMVPTPPDSIANGVVMSVSALSNAIRELWKTSRIKTNRVVSSVSGADALIVRVLEVPQMSDGELADNMKMDVDRYIPFPPSEVVIDFKALRDLPASNADNMEVLLAAAKQEVVDLHLKVLQAARLDPVAIDVEPLAAARALGVDTSDGFADYNDVWSLINIGATGTEISVLRGDMLVFTRTVPTGGNALTQALSETLGMSWSEAEQAKRMYGDALPHMDPAHSGAYAAGNHDFDDFPTNFDDTGWNVPGEETAAVNAPNALYIQTAPDALGVPGAQGAASANRGPEGATATDPFDPDFFAQGPQSEPTERQGQREPDDTPKPESTPFDFSAFSLSDEPEPDPTTPDTPASPAADTSAAYAPVADAPASDAPASDAPASDTPVTQETLSPDSTTPMTPAVSVPDVTADEPSAPAADQTQGQAAGSKGSGFDFSFAFDETPPAPEPPATESQPTADAATADADATATDTPEEDALTGSEPGAMPDDTGPTPVAGDDAAGQVVSAGTTGTTILPADTESAYDLSDFGMPGIGPAATPVPTGATGAAGNIGDDFDLDQLFGATPGTPAGGAGLAPDMASGAAAPAGSDPFGGSNPFGNAVDFGDDPFGGGQGDFGAGLGDFGAGLGGGVVQDTAALQGTMAPVLEELANEIRRSLEYHASRYPDAVVRRITLVGGGARLTNLDAYLTQVLGIPTSVGTPVGRLSLQAPQLPPDYAEVNGPMLAVAMGLALREFTF